MIEPRLENFFVHSLSLSLLNERKKTQQKTSGLDELKKQKEKCEAVNEGAAAVKQQQNMLQHISEIYGFVL